MMLRVAWRNLFESKARLLISVGGVALALLLILALDALMAGSERQMTAYIDRSGADLFVAQAGVRNMHMASSALPAETVDIVAAVPGVRTVTPILYLSSVLAYGENRAFAYVIGIKPDAEIGGPWEITAGTARPEPGTIVLDQGLAQNWGLGLGDQIEVLGVPFTISGLGKGLGNLVNSVAFVSFEDFARARGGDGTISYLLVAVEDGFSVEEVREAVAARLPEATVMTRIEFSAGESQVIGDMSTDFLNIMNGIGFLIGLAVTGLTVYTATLSKRREYGVLKALGARSKDLYGVVAIQAALSLGMGLIVAVGIVLLMAWGIPRLTPGVLLVLTVEGLTRALVLAGVIGLLASLLPVRQIAGLDPVSVFRR